MCEKEPASAIQPSDDSRWRAYTAISRPDARMRIIPPQAEILILKIEDRPALGIDDHLRQRPRRG